jgi:membrane-bound lytic murein transglycosylase D
LGWLALALVTTAPGVAAGWGGEPLSPAALAADNRQLAAIPQPPLPPPLPAGIAVETPDDASAGLAPSPVEMATPEPPAPLVFDDPIFEDPRAEVVVRLTPGIPVPSYPIVLNPTVEALIDYFTARERERFGLWIARSGRYLSMIQRIFRERGLPTELAYTAMIESGFSPRAVSRVGAKGLWQFMEATARRYGLVVNRWVDERLDPVKSTVAAARYLGDLYGMFGHWFLAQAAYNAGEARVDRAMKRAKTSDFWALTQTRHLPNETKRFVPQILAATVITQAPTRYGFDVTMETPLAYDEVAVKRVLDFETIAALAKVPVEAVRELNPALRGGVTPPFASYVLRLPAGAGARFEAELQAATPAKLVVWGLHRIARNQSLAEIARLYRTTPQRLADVNQLRGGRLRGVTELLVPLSNKVGKVVAPRIAVRDGDRLLSRIP